MAQSNPVEAVLETAERELEEAIAALNDLFDHNFIYLLPKDASDGSQPSPPPPEPTKIDLKKLSPFLSEDQSKLRSKMSDILPKLSKARRTINLSSNDNRNDRQDTKDFVKLFDEADDAYNIPTRTPNSSIFSNEDGGIDYDAERRFTDVIRKASLAYSTYEKSQYNDDNSRREFETLLKNADQQLKLAKKTSKTSMDDVNNNNNNNNSGGKDNGTDSNKIQGRQHAGSIFDEFDVLMRQADVVFRQGQGQGQGQGQQGSQGQDDEKDSGTKRKNTSKNGVKDARVGIKQSLAIISEQLVYVSKENEKLIAKDEKQRGKGKGNKKTDSKDNS